MIVSLGKAAVDAEKAQLGLNPFMMRGWHTCVFLYSISVDVGILNRCRRNMTIRSLRQQQV